MCCALWEEGIIRSYFYKNEAVQNFATMGESNRALANDFFVSEMVDVDFGRLLVTTKRWYVTYSQRNNKLTYGNFW